MISVSLSPRAQYCVVPFSPARRSRTIAEHTRVNKYVRVRAFSILRAPATTPGSRRYRYRYHYYRSYYYCRSRGVRAQRTESIPGAFLGFNGTNPRHQRSYTRRQLPRLLADTRHSPPAHAEVTILARIPSYRNLSAVGFSPNGQASRDVSAVTFFASSASERHWSRLICAFTPRNVVNVRTNRWMRR